MKKPAARLCFRALRLLQGLDVVRLQTLGPALHFELDLLASFRVLKPDIWIAV